MNSTVQGFPCNNVLINFNVSKESLAKNKDKNQALPFYPAGEKSQVLSLSSLTFLKFSFTKNC